MRLGDLDALKDVLWDACPQTEQMNGYEIRAFIDAAPTVCCERCRHWDGGPSHNGRCDSDWVTEFLPGIDDFITPPNWSCPEFEGAPHD